MFSHFQKATSVRCSVCDYEGKAKIVKDGLGRMIFGALLALVGLSGMSIGSLGPVPDTLMIGGFALCSVYALSDFDRICPRCRSRHIDTDQS